MKGGYDFKKTDPYIPVEEPAVGQSYHLDWANRQCVWKLIAYDSKTGICLLRTPKTKKEIKAMKHQLRHTRTTQAKLQRQQIK